MVLVRMCNLISLFLLSHFPLVPFMPCITEQHREGVSSWLTIGVECQEIITFFPPFNSMGIVLIPLMCAPWPHRN